MDENLPTPAAPARPTQPNAMTANKEVDAALAALGDLAERPLAEHHQALLEAHDVLVQQLEAGREAAHNPIPAGLRPNHG